MFLIHHTAVFWCAPCLCVSVSARPALVRIYLSSVGHIANIARNMGVCPRLLLKGRQTAGITALGSNEESTRSERVVLPVPPAVNCFGVAIANRTRLSRFTVCDAHLRLVTIELVSTRGIAPLPLASEASTLLLRHAEINWSGRKITILRPYGSKPHALPLSYALIVWHREWESNPHMLGLRRTESVHRPR